MYMGNSIEGWMSPAELAWLYEMSLDMDSIVEVGSWKGKSTHALLSGGNAIVHAVDHWLGEEMHRDGAHKEAKLKDLHAEFVNNLKEFPNLIVHRGYSVEIAKKFEDKSVDMVFIDGAHVYKEVLADILAWKDKPMKLLCGHDEFGPGVKQALKETFPNYKKVPNTSIWYVRYD